LAILPTISISTDRFFGSGVRNHPLEGSLQNSQQVVALFRLSKRNVELYDPVSINFGGLRMKARRSVRYAI
jgi:hypothetical protein